MPSACSRVFADWKVDAFVSRPVEDDPGVFDDWKNRTRSLWGVYATHPLRDGRASISTTWGPNRDAEFAQGTADEMRHSLGARLFGESARLGLQLRGRLPVRNRSAAAMIVAWTFASDTGFTLRRRAAHAAVGLKADAISGDGDPDDDELGTFNPLFPRGAYFSEAALVWPANLVDVDPTLELQLTDRLPAHGVGRLLALQQRRRPLHQRRKRGAAAGRQIPVSSATSRASRSRGRWTATRRLNLAYTHFFAGDFIRESGPDSDVDFVGVWLLYRF